MPAHVDLQELFHAHEWLRAAEPLGADAAVYIDRASGKVHWVGEGIDEDPPDDIEDGSRYIALPCSLESAHGRELAIDFVDERLPRSSDEVRRIFQKRGAFRRFKALLDDAGLLYEWHRFEQTTTEAALVQWGAENGLDVA